MTDYSSIDPKELEKFQRIASQWWDKEGEFKILHKINPIRLSYITEKISQYLKSSNRSLAAINILDVGCGGGLITVPLCKLGANITGIDAIAENIMVAQNYAAEHNLSINYLQSTVEKLPKQHNQYDVVICLEVIEHVASPSDFVKNLASLVKPSGILIISTINRTIKSYLLAVLMAEYVLGWVPKQTHNYNKFLKPSELNSMLTSNQLTLKELQGLTFNLITQDWQLSNDIEVNYFAYAIKEPSANIT